MPEPVRSGQRYLPGLDGLRAVAVLAVVAYHVGLRWAPGGLLGVGVFFTLSGYIITDLLLGSHARTGSLELVDFWLRRARRLLPAVFVMLTVVIGWVALFDRSQLAALRGGAAAAIASRHVPGASFVEAQPLTRRLGGHVFRTLSGALVSGIADTQCGFKFFQRPAVTAALVRTRTTGFAFDVELLHRIQRDGGEVVELPVAWTDRAGSTFHPVRDGIASYRAVLALHGGVR